MAKSGRVPVAWQGLPREALLLLAWSRPSYGTRQQALAEDLLAGSVDWARLARLSLRHRLAPLVAARIAEYPGAAPSEIVVGFQRVAQANGRRTMLMIGQLVLITRWFEAEKIDFACLKGPALAQVADGAQGLRIILDIDLVVTHDDGPRATALMLDKGYRIDVPFAANAKADILLNPRARLTVELHRRVYGSASLPFSLNFSDSRTRVQRVLVGRQPVPVLPPEENLLYLAFHGSKHFWARLAWVTGFAGFAQATRSMTATARLNELAKRLRAERYLQLACAIGSLVTAEPMTMAAGRSSTVDRLARDLLHRAMQEAPPPNGLPMAVVELLQRAASEIDGEEGPGLSSQALLHVPAPLEGWRYVALLFRLRGRVPTHLWNALRRRVR